MGPGTLGKVLAGLPAYRDANVLVTGATFDDAGIYQVSPELALVQTVDFFTPMVDDPYDFGRVAVANSLSDVYAMGGLPKTALNVVSFPINCLDHGILREIMRGGADKLMEAQVALLGGHTVDDPEPKYGVSVTGFVSPDKIWTNQGAQPGDVLILTKRLGSGLVTTALKGDALKDPDREIPEVTESMAQLNRLAAQTAREIGGVHACTDITGFGFLGHLGEMVGEDPITMYIEGAPLPFLSQAPVYSKEGLAPAGAYRNLEYLGERVEFLVEDWLKMALVTPETSGGLLLAFSSEDGARYLKAMAAQGQFAAAVGKVGHRKDSPDIVVY